MRSIFTVHAGEFLVGEYIERNFPELNVWIPSKDTGIDLLVTNKQDPSKSVSLQVKMSRDYKPAYATDNFSRKLLASGWMNLAHEKIKKSPANYWVFVLVSHERKMAPKYIVIPPSKLLECLVKIHGESKKYNFHPWILKLDQVVALEGRGLSGQEKEELANGCYCLNERDFTDYLDCWDSLKNIIIP